MNKWTVGTLILVAFGVFARAQTPQPNLKTVDVGLAVRLHQPLVAIRAGEPIQVAVDLSNEGKQPILICRDLEFLSESCHWQFETRDASGRQLPGVMGVADRIVGAPMPFPNALISNWLTLAPNYKYGTMMDLEDAIPSKARPGRYTVRAILTSDGPGAQSVYNDLLHYPDELANLPYPGWKGKAASNWISVNVVSTK